MDKKKIAPKAAQKKASKPLQEQATTDDDPQFIGQRLKGLARLVDCAAGCDGYADPIDQDAAFFISSELEQIAEQLIRS